MYKKQLGFSLIELSVVIVIIGFIIAAIVGGKNIIDTAKIRAVITEIGEHQQSAYSFKLKYDKFPGDYNEAVEHWGAGTVNGNANGQIDFRVGTVYEGYRAWQQLSYSKMTKAVYAGTETTGAAQLEVDVPRSNIMGGYFFNYEFSDYAGTPNELISNINVIALGRPLASGGSRLLLAGAVTPTQGLAIDNKTDGGVPTTGSIVGVDGSGSAAGTCVRDNGTAGPTPDDIYDITLTGFDCVIAVAFKQE